MLHEWLQRTCLALHNLCVGALYPPIRWSPTLAFTPEGSAKLYPNTFPFCGGTPGVSPPMSAAVRPFTQFRCINASYCNYSRMYFTIKTFLGRPGEPWAAAARCGVCPGRLFLRAAVTTGKVFYDTYFNINFHINQSPQTSICWIKEIVGIPEKIARFPAVNS